MWVVDGLSCFCVCSGWGGCGRSGEGARFTGSWWRNVTTCVSAVDSHNYSATNSSTEVKQPPRRGENDHCLMLCLGHRFTPVFDGGGGGRSKNVRNACVFWPLWRWSNKLTSLAEPACAYLKSHGSKDGENRSYREESWMFLLRG